MSNPRSIWSVGLVVVTCLANFGCMNPEGMYRTQLDRWNRVSIPELGLSIELPIKAGAGGPQILVYSQEDNHAVLIKMHLYWCVPSVDSSMMVTVTRLAKDRFLRYERGAAGGGLPGVAFVNKQLGTFSRDMRFKEVASGYGVEGPFLCYRKDYIAPNADFVLVGGEIWPQLLKNSNTFLEKDKKSIERIINSVQFLK